jgi:hypothetical protein
MFSFFTEVFDFICNTVVTVAESPLALPTLGVGALTMTASVVHSARKGR